MTEKKHSKSFLNKLEDIFAESDYFLRYEKGNFKSGWCELKDHKVIIVNKYYTNEGKISTLLSILKTVGLDTKGFSDKNKKFLAELNQSKLHL
jgi:hypothetical protein